MSESRGWAPTYHVGGRMVDDPSRLYQVRGGGWVEPAPRACPNGHKFGPGTCLVGSLACTKVGGSHRTHICVACDAVIYTPPARPDCDHDMRSVPVR
ncbi:hypothetical protein [Nocardia takedensis]|uniref:hypothetical protein n=1 Tax=Nocardia takedensis TaxID=259390 RepID=UPI0002D52CF6|nr:hypothetical protein [Nocardia takedensis]